MIDAPAPAFYDPQTPSGRGADATDAKGRREQAEALSRSLARLPTNDVEQLEIEQMRQQYAQRLTAEASKATGVRPALQVPERVATAGLQDAAAGRASVPGRKAAVFAPLTAVEAAVADGPRTPRQQRSTESYAPPAEEAEGSKGPDGHKDGLGRRVHQFLHGKRGHGQGKQKK